MNSSYGLRYELLNKDNLNIAFRIQKETWVDDPDSEDLYDKATNTKDDNFFFLYMIKMV